MYYYIKLYCIVKPKVLIIKAKIVFFQSRFPKTLNSIHETIFSCLVYNIGLYGWDWKNRLKR